MARRGTMQARPRRDADAAWKTVLRSLLPDCIAFLQRDLHRAIDWTYPPEYLDKELQAITRWQGRRGRRDVDLLARSGCGTAGSSGYCCIWRCKGAGRRTSLAAC